MTSPQAESRYRIEGLLGIGGNGQVYRARDTHLDRPVALKILRGGEPDSEERMLREARAQVRVEHPNVCRVLEAGKIDGKPFIAMQLVQGGPIDEAAQGMTVRDKVELMRKVAEAVQAAHSKGLVHRDLKPGNVLVEQREGVPEPVVVDFGLAIEPATPGLTLTGVVKGTPGYMAPEQISGDRAHIDRRTDVWAMGAILYRLLSGRPPYDGGSALQVLVESTRKDPVPLRKVAPEVPRDLAMIVEKCLEREPENRYGSARLLAEDLERFLTGEPLHARPVSVVYRWARRARRHPVASSAITLATATVLGLGGMVLHSRATAAEQASIAHRFGREVERIETGMRLAHLAALHDIRPQKEELRRRLHRLEAELPELGAVARGPGSYALGTGHLSLGEPRRAVEHLERAWSTGYRPPEVARALALALGSLYQQGLADAAGLDDPTLREARRAELDSRYRDRALALLQQTETVEGEPTGLLEARLAYYEGRWEDAAALSAQALEEAPWLYEAHLLQGDALAAAAARGTEALDLEAMTRLLEQADEAYRLAAEEGRSDPRAHDGRCSTGAQAAVSLFFGPGGDLQPRIEAAVAACQRSLIADPDRGRPHALTASLWLMASRDLNRRGSDPMPAMDRAIEAGRSAVRLEPDVANHHRSLGSALAFRGEYERERGIDSSTTLDESVHQLEQAIALEPRDAANHNSLGLAQWERILWARDYGEDQLPHIEAAAQAFRRATQLLASHARAFSNLGSIYNLRTEYELEHGLDPEGSMAAAAHAFAQAIAADPDYVYAYNNLGNVHRNRGKLSLDRGRDPSEHLRQAERYFREAAERNPNWSFPHFNIGLGLHTLAQWKMDTGIDPGEALDAAAEAFRQGLAIKGDLPRALLSAALVELIRARYRLEQNGDARPVLAQAQRLVERAQELEPGSAYGLGVQGELELLRAWSDPRRAEPHFGAAAEVLEAAARQVPDNVHYQKLLAELAWHRAAWERGRGRSPAATLTRGLEAAEHALRIHPEAAEAAAFLGELHLLRSELDGDASVAAAAARALARALEIKPTLAHRHGPSLAKAREMAAR